MPHRVVQLRGRYLALGQRLRERFERRDAEGRRHLHVDPGRQRAHAGVLVARCELVRQQIVRGARVGHDKAREAPGVAEHVGQQPAVARRGRAVEAHIRAHDVASARVDGSLERLEIDVPQFAVGQVDLIIVSPAQRGAIASEMLGAGDDVARTAEIGALEAANLRGSHRGPEIGILAGTFDNAAPTRIARDVDHRRERPMQADSTRLGRGDRLAILGDLGVPTRSDGNRHGHDRAQPVDHVKAEQERDLEAGLLDRDMLQSVELDRIVHEQERTGARRGHLVRHALRLSRRRREVEILRNLPGLLLGRHLRDQGIRAGTNRLVAEWAATQRRALRKNAPAIPKRRDQGGSRECRPTKCAC